MIPLITFVRVHRNHGMSAKKESGISAADSVASIGPQHLAVQLAASEP